MEKENNANGYKFVSNEVLTREQTNTINLGKDKNNRLIKHDHVSKLKKQFIKSWEVMPHITVNVETSNIIDGQHRLKAFQELVDDGLLPSDAYIRVMYVSIPVNEEKEAIIDANTNSKNWSIDDYINSYANAGNTSYKLLKNWCEQHTLASCIGKDKKPKAKYRYGAAIIKQQSMQKQLKDGTFACTSEELQAANETHVELESILEYCGITTLGPWIEHLAVSWCAYRNMHPINIWFKAFKERSKTATFKNKPKSNKKEWDDVFGDIHLYIDKNNIK